MSPRSSKIIVTKNKRKGEKKERLEGKEEKKKKKTMVALLVFIIVTLEIATLVYLAITFSKKGVDIVLTQRMACQETFRYL